MGNCFQSPRNQQTQFESLVKASLPKPERRRHADSVPDLSSDFETGAIVYPKENYPRESELKHLKQSGDAVVRDVAGLNSSTTRLNDQDQNDFSNQNAISVKQPGFSTHTPNQEKADPAWMRFIHPKATGDRRADADAGSVFAENWDPALFDQRGTPKTLRSHRYKDEPQNGRSHPYDRRARMNRRGCSYNGDWDKWHSDESLIEQPVKRNRPPLISSAILGFSQLQTDVSDSMEWFRNGELESPQPNAHNFLIKGKQKPSTINTTTTSNSSQSTGLNENNSDAEKISSPNGIKPEETDYREGWLRYTMFMHQEQSDAANFHMTFRKAKHTFLSLEARTGCEIRLSKQLFVHRGKLVRTVVIDGPSRKHILRCYSSLPRHMIETIILDCERPSISEHRPMVKLPDPEAGIGNYPTFAPRAVLV